MSRPDSCTIIPSAFPLKTMQASFKTASIVLALALVQPPLVVLAATQTFQPSGANAKDWKLLGCANDLYPNARALNAAYSEQPNGQSTSIATCIQYCDGQGAYLAGIEYGYQCYCGPSLDNGASIQVAAQSLSPTNNGGCTTACKGDATQNCGGERTSINTHTH